MQDMNTFPSTEHAIALAVLIFVGFLAARAWTNGVLKMLWAISGLALGIAVGFFYFQNSNALLSRWMPGKELGFRANMVGSVISALFAYLLFRQLCKSILQKVFNPEGPLAGWAEGFRGAVLSLVPSVLTVLVVGLALRMSGTILELQNTARVCAPASAYKTEDYPRWPMLADWRDAYERLPYVTEAYQLVDPISRKTERNLVMLLMTSRNQGLLRHLGSHDPTALIVNGALFQALLADGEIRKLVEDNKHVALLRHPQVVAAAENKVLKSTLSALHLSRFIDSYMLSPERQAMIQSYERPKVPEF